MEALRARLTQTQLVVLDAATAQELQCEEEGLLRAARLLAQAGQAQLLSRGRPVSPTEARGPLTLRRA